MEMLLPLLFLGVVCFICFRKKDNAIVKNLGRGKTTEQIESLRYFYNKGCGYKMVSDAEYISMLKKHRDSLNLQQRSLSKIGIDEEEVNEIKPITFEGFLYADNPKVHVKQNTSGKWISSNYMVTWLFFSSTQIYIYTYTFSMTDDKKIENTEEFFYKDITSVSTTFETEKILMADGSKERKEFEISSNKLKLVVPGEKIFIALESIDSNVDVDSTIQGLKQKVREKKM